MPNTSRKSKLNQNINPYLNAQANWRANRGNVHSIMKRKKVRDEKLNISKNKGLVQVMSLLPVSYPGHNILTEDMGIIRGEDDCKCGKKGKYFEILGRVPGTEIRGCSDAY